MADNLFVGDAEEQKEVDELLESEMGGFGTDDMVSDVILQIDDQGSVQSIESEKIEEKSDKPTLESMDFGNEKRSDDEVTLNEDSDKMLSAEDTNEASIDNQYSDLFVVDSEKWISPDSYLQCLLTGEEPYIDSHGIHYYIENDFDIALQSSVMASQGSEENENITNPDFREVIPEEELSVDNDNTIQPSNEFVAFEDAYESVIHGQPISSQENDNEGLVGSEIAISEEEKEAEFDNSVAFDLAQEQADAKDIEAATKIEQTSTSSLQSDDLLSRLDTYIENVSEEVSTKEAYREQLASRLSQIYRLEQRRNSLDLEIGSMVSKFNKQLGDENAKKL